MHIRNWDSAHPWAGDDIEIKIGDTTVCKVSSQIKPRVAPDVKPNDAFSPSCYYLSLKQFTLKPPWQQSRTCCGSHLARGTSVNVDLITWGTGETAIVIRFRKWGWGGGGGGGLPCIAKAEHMELHPSTLQRAGTRGGWHRSVDAISSPSTRRQAAGTDESSTHTTQN